MYSVTTTVYLQLSQQPVNSCCVVVRSSDRCDSCVVTDVVLGQISFVISTVEITT